MIEGNHIRVPLKRNGTSQRNRPLSFLDPDHIKIDDRGPKEFLELAKKIAKGIRFYHQEDPSIVDDWEAFFQQNENMGQSHPPHYALFLAFLELFQLSINNLNTITKRHLDYFYEQVLHFRKNPAVPDRVHVVLELARNIDRHLLRSGALFNAGKDSENKPLHYRLLSDTLFTKAKLTSIKQLHFPSEKVTVMSIDNEEEKVDLKEVTSFLGQTITENAEKDLAVIDPWAPFGDESLTKLGIGWAIASPVLLMKEGTRKVDFTITGNYTGEDERLDRFELTNDDLLLSFSTEEGWFSIPLESEIIVTGGQGEENIVIQFNCEIPSTVPAITALANREEGDQIISEWPMAKMLLNPESKAFPYDILRQIELIDIKLKVQVEGVRDLLLQNDQFLLDAGRPFEPFGREAPKGANFYIGSTEVFQKSLKRITLQLHWHTPPASDLGKYFESYKDTTRQNKSFTASVELLDDGRWKSLTGPGESLRLFTNDLTLPVAIGIRTEGESLPDENFSIEAAGLERDRDASLQVPEKYDISSQRGFMRLRLDGSDFGHRTYPMLLNDTIVKNTQGAGLPLPNEPYTPVLAGISLNYETEHVISHNETIDQIFHIHPFGWSRHDYYEDTPRLLPQYDGEGSLYLGFSDVSLPQELSLLFQVVEGSADPDVTVPEIEWSYLQDNTWTIFKDTEILSDRTHHLNRSGIITFSIPALKSTANTILPVGYFWIRGKTVNNASGTCKVLDIRTQAAPVVLVYQDNAADHLGHPLPPGSISDLVDSDSRIKEVLQPYPSFGGKSQERAQQFYTRISERISHKGRALSIWDYERLILEQFPSLYKVKCFKHSSFKEGYQPGTILVVPIPDIRNNRRIHPFKPLTSLNQMEEIHEFARDIAPPSAAIDVHNGLFEEVEVSFMVKFREGAHAGFNKTHLIEEIHRFLSPWAFDEGEDITFGSSIYKSSILNFVEERPYVDFVTFFTMNQRDEHGNQKLNIEEAVASSPLSILVSATTHDIRVVRDESTICADGIGHMIVEKTFTQIKG